MRAIWTGLIGFGLVNIPVRMIGAVDESELDLDMLDKNNHANIKLQRVNAKTGEEVAWKDIVKGFKLEDRYVVLDDADFEKASREKSKIIEIDEFVDEDEVESIYFESPYYLEPDKNGAKAYVLLRDALKETGKVGLGSYVLRNRESLGLIKPLGDVLVLNKIRFQQEIRNVENLKIPRSKSSAAEMQMAVELINQKSGPFDISKYEDTYSAELLKVISAKAEGRRVKAPTIRVYPSRSKDLIAQLKASLRASKQRAS